MAARLEGQSPSPASPDRPTLSATVICQDEAEKIRGCLESVRFCDEVVVVDSGSTDGTLEICRELADRVIERDWPGYVAQQNYARAEARGEWVLSIDADERVTPELAREIGLALEGDPEVEGFRVSRHVHYLGRWIDHSGWYPEPRVRLFRRDRGRWEGIDPHYDVTVDGRVGDLGGEIVHYTYDDLEDHVRTLNRFSSILAREHRARGRRFSWASLVLRPPLEFLKKYVLKRGFLDGAPGFFVAVLSSFYVFLKLAKLWEAERVGDRRPWRDGG
ncbi:MAG: glycosyltransferase family 2 protein [Deferrisomatales bacterium]|nr:glycosyltransferase family 2 protein [Deferrisomatales bacterium]